MSYQLIALDLDGTLLDEKLVISPRTKRIFQELEQNGVLATLATGRMYSSAKYYAKILNLKLPIIVYNGGLIVNPIDDEILYENTIPVSIMEKVIQYCHKNTLYLQFYDANSIIVEKITTETKIDPDLIHASCYEVTDFLNHPIKPSPKMMIVSNPGNISKIQKELRLLFKGHLDFVLSKPYLLEILHYGASKGVALQFLANHYNIPSESVMAIGDSENDESMIRWAGLGISVSNGTSTLKASADFCTTAPQHLGVEEAIMRFVFDDESKLAPQDV